MRLCGEPDIASVPEILESCDSLFFALLWKSALRLFHHPSFQNPTKYKDFHNHAMLPDEMCYMIMKSPLLY